ncbi:hypothetical protein DFH08DRAFT_900682 [Mycena albidolilacea]|uniref:Uncharacterized protein n=1 Tax=Mycena albidolilacea TaxID=1033008 RepID=A0AAD6Z5D6_9AGAR|nr:hypothetical protein DFH08DRAFT_900682 [Mycena albidolilacea]
MLCRYEINGKISLDPPGLLQLNGCSVMAIVPGLVTSNTEAVMVLSIVFFAFRSLDEGSTTLSLPFGMSGTYMPPTSHTLPDAQRRRLMRSTRKVGALLGETPRVVPTALTPLQSFTMGHSRSRSTTGTESKRSGRWLGTASDTVSRASSLRLGRKAAVAETDASGAQPIVRPLLILSLPMPGTFSPAERTFPSPSPRDASDLTSPTTPSPTADTTRRLRMAKLVRTLGENVPTELVFPVSGSRQRRASMPTVPISILELRRGLLPSRDDSAYIDESFSYPYTIPEHRSSDSYVPTKDSHTVSFPDDPSTSMCPHQHTRAIDTTHRREIGWSGEWGQTGDSGARNMDDVVRTLRRLRLK